jgi:hypothetical protein
METGREERASVSIDGEEYVPRSSYDSLREERDRLAEELARVRQLRTTEE